MLSGDTNPATTTDVIYYVKCAGERKDAPNDGNQEKKRLPVCGGVVCSDPCMECRPMGPDREVCFMPDSEKCAPGGQYQSPNPAPKRPWTPGDTNQVSIQGPWITGGCWDA